MLLILENAEMRPCELVRALFGLRLNGWFEGISGVLIGRNGAPDTTRPASLSYNDALRSALAGVSCPVLYDLDIGHVPPQFSLVHGALAQVEFRDGSATIVQQLGTSQRLERQA